MPEGIGTEVTLSASQEAYESLFGESPEADAEDVEIRDPDGEVVKDSRSPEHCEDGASPPAEELKVVLSIKGGRAIIGVQQPSFDPHIESFEDKDLSGLVHEVLAVTERARAKWDDEPRHPAYTKPAPPPKRQSRRAQQGSAEASTPEDATDQPQPEALKLF